MAKADQTMDIKTDQSGHIMLNSWPNLGSDSKFPSWAELKDLFRKAGRVTYTDAHDRLGKNKGEVCFESASDVKEAIRKFDGYELNGRDITVKKSVSHTYIIPSICGND